MLVVKFFLAAVLLAGQVEQRGESTEIGGQAAEKGQGPEAGGQAAERGQWSEVRVQGEQNSVDTPREKQLVLLRQKSAELDRLQREVQELRAATGTSQQILVRVQMLEVSLTKLSRLGLGFADGRLGGVIGLEGETRRGGDGESVGSKVDGSKGLLSFLDALNRNQVAKPLAEPNVVVVSGRPATFHVGGEMPVPSGDGGRAAVEFRKFGTELDVLAVAVGNERVRLEMRARVSEIDEAHAVEVNGVHVPRLRVRACDTSTVLAFGESAVLSGLVEQRVVSFTTKDGRVEEELEEVGLLVVVTPERVEE